MALASLKNEIVNMFQESIHAESGSEYEIIKDEEKGGKLYEAYSLAILCRNLKEKESFRLILSKGEKLYLKRGTGPINRNYPCIQAYRNDELVAEIWTDVCFISLSYLHTSPSLRPEKPQYGDYHELDILMVDPGLESYPTPYQIWLGVECKNTGMKKGILKEILGVRRELSLIKEECQTKFSEWPQSKARSTPPSCLLLFSSDPSVENYSRPGNFYDIKFIHEPFE